MGSQAITYDAIGNMLTDGTHTNVWEHGRQLESVTMHTDVVEGECMEDGYDAASGATSTIVFTGGNRVASGTQTVTATAQVVYGGEDITNELPASAFTWTRDSGRSAEDATWNAAHQNVKQVTLTSADMNGDVQIACGVQGEAATFGSVAVGSDYAVSYTRSAADAGDTLSLSSGILSVETSTNTYSLDDGSLKVLSGFTGTVTASATVFFERPAKTVEFSYNLDGMRAEKKVTRLGVETTTSYTYSGKKLTHLVCGTNSMHFYYDVQGRPSIVQYNNGSTTNNYTYVHNLQGDVVGILDSTGTLVVEYKYDAWGKPLSTTGTLATTLGIENPFRYRGYVYDEETEYYYLRNRYYDPSLRRFVNSDSIINTKEILFNTFIYCINNPLRYIDPNGMDSSDGVGTGQMGLENTGGVAIGLGAFAVFKAIQNATSETWRVVKSTAKFIKEKMNKYGDAYYIAISLNWKDPFTKKRFYGPVMALSAPMTFEQAQQLIIGQTLTVEYVCDQFGFDAADIAVIGILTTNESNAKALAESIGGEDAYPHPAHNMYNENALPHWHMSTKDPLHSIHIWYME